MEQLKPCPFCGNKADRKENRKYRKGYRASVGCVNQLCPAKITQATLFGNAEDAYRHAENVWNERRYLTIGAAIQTLTEALKEDRTPGSYYYSWQANIACTVMDNSDVDHETANKIAIRFLDLLIG